MPLRTRSVRRLVRRTTRRLPPGKVTTLPPRRTKPRFRAEIRTRTLLLWPTAAWERDTTSTRTGGSAAAAAPGAAHAATTKSTDAPASLLLTRRILTTLVTLRANGPPTASHPCPGSPRDRRLRRRRKRFRRRAARQRSRLSARGARRWWSRSTPMWREARSSRSSKLLDKFPFASQVERQLQQRLESGDIDYENDLKPLLGNEFVVGATDAQAVVDRGDGNDEFIGAIQVKDKGKLEDADREGGGQGGGRHGRRQGLRGRRRRRLRDRGRRAGGGQHAASSSTSALEQRDADDRLTEETFDKGTEGLPKDALIRVYGDLQKLLASDPDTADARKVKWVGRPAHPRRHGLVHGRRGRPWDFRLGTDGGDLSDEDLPMATGDESPRGARPAERDRRGRCATRRRCSASARAPRRP